MKWKFKEKLFSGIYTDSRNRLALESLSEQIGTYLTSVILIELVIYAEKYADERKLRERTKYQVEIGDNLNQLPNLQCYQGTVIRVLNYWCSYASPTFPEFDDRATINLSIYDIFGARSILHYHL